MVIQNSGRRQLEDEQGSLTCQRCLGFFFNGGGGKGRLGRGQNVISILLDYENLKVLTVKANKQIQ